MAEVIEQDLVITEGKVEAYRTKSKCPSNMRAMSSEREICGSGVVPQTNSLQCAPFSDIFPEKDRTTHVVEPESAEAK